ncbi:flp pilus-assembly TadE/G-like family protein [Saccharopolyspora sp. HNM0983]|uniref:Flp pilus-assembly TadE/G-like family protein n=1 Tax=Saccharopolyspora montiporae TaxID=2781240 RepID=A0A929FZW2_9PSEU|nr:flp pilus-assembly TadE/G-like family protein [Saccharopolyspora sp. HNM0983]
MRRFGGDGGAATPFAATLVLVLISVLWVVVQAGSAVAARHRAEGAADLAALAAAAHSATGAAAACGHAEVVAAAMGTGLTSCTVSVGEARVQLRASVPGLGEVTGRARAGPVDGSPPARWAGTTETPPPACGAGRVGAPDSARRTGCSGPSPVRTARRSR